MVSIRKRQWTSPKGKKQTRWLVDHRDAFGRRKAKQFATQTEARQYAEEHDLRSIDDEPSTKTVADACEAWLQRGEAEELERSTLAGYKSVIDQCIGPYLGHIPLQELTREQVHKFRQDVTKAKSPASARRAVHHLKMVLNYVEDWVGRNVARKVRSTLPARRRISERRKNLQILTLAEARNLLKACDRQTGGGRPKMRRRNRLLLMLLMETGIRPSEARGLSWPEVKFKTREVEILQRADRWNDIGPCKTAASYRKIPISTHLAAELKKWHAVCPKSEHDLVFPTASGKPLLHSNIIREFRLLQFAAGLTNLVTSPSGKQRRVSRYRVYDLRHFRASWWIFQRIDLKSLTTWLGHSSIQVTFDIYGHLIQDAEAEQVLATALEDVLYLEATAERHATRRTDESDGND